MSHKKKKILLRYYLKDEAVSISLHTNPLGESILPDLLKLILS